MTTRVLIADDQAEIREALELLVASDPGLEFVGAAEDAEQAIELARLHQPNVALIDFKMPAGGGPRATREIRVCSPKTRVVALSAYEDRSSVFQMLRAGAVGYLVKGASAAEVLSAINRSARGDRVLSPAVTAEVVHELAEQLERESAVEEERRERTARIKRVLEEGGIHVVFQPIVELEGRTPVGYEALARFIEGPKESAGEWFADAQDVGLRTELELAAMDIALAQAKLVPTDTFISINAGPEMLVTPAAASLLMRSPFERIVLEMTEHAPIADYETLKRALFEFRNRGGRLAVDDAGAGFASLRHVLKLSPDILKIDGSLIRGIQSDRAARALTSALLTFATEMNQMIIAEGIEDEQTVVELEALGVRYGQGFYLGRPAPIEAPRFAAAG
jgi:EAL domain-containing protein (putative c-di-GMP-specific phosphodiesterase class I)